MKEVSNNNNRIDTVFKLAERKGGIENNTILKANYNLSGGKKLFCLDLMSCEIEEVKGDAEPVAVYNVDSRTVIGYRKNQYKDGCLYITAINKKNAEKKFKKMIYFLHMNITANNL